MMIDNEMIFKMEATKYNYDTLKSRYYEYL